MTVTYALIAANVAVFLWGLVRQPAAGLTGSELVRVDLGLFGPFVADGHEWYRLITAGFTHGGPLHILFNMLVIWQFSSMLEPSLGRARFTALYFAALLGGSAGALLMSPGALTVGASGAAFGLVGAAAVAFRQRGISLWSTGIGMMLVINLGITFAVPGISIGGHLGGLAAGAAVAAVYFGGRTGMRSLPVSIAAAGAVAVLSVAVGIVAAGL